MRTSLWPVSRRSERVFDSRFRRNRRFRSMTRALCSLEPCSSVASLPAVLASPRPSSNGRARRSRPRGRFASAQRASALQSYQGWLAEAADSTSSASHPHVTNKETVTNYCSPPAIARADSFEASYPDALVSSAEPMAISSSISPRAPPAPGEPVLREFPATPPRGRPTSRRNPRSGTGRGW